MKTIVFRFSAALIAVLGFSLTVRAQEQNAPVGHPYVEDHSMMGMSGPHPLSSAEALKRLQAAGYKLSGPLTLSGRFWVAHENVTDKVIQIDAITGSTQEVEAK